MEMVNVIAGLLAVVIYFLWQIAKSLEQIGKQLRNYHIQADERHEAGKANFWSGVERLEKAVRRPA